MNQHFLAHLMQSVLSAHGKLPALIEALDHAIAYEPIHLTQGQLLSAEHVQAATEHQERVSRAEIAVNGQKSAIQSAMEKLLSQLPELIKERVQGGLPLVAQWQADGIEPLALVYQYGDFKVRRYDRVDDLLRELRSNS